MPAPVILTVTSPVAVGNQVLVTGTSFSRVAACALVDTITSEVIDTPDFIVDHGQSIHLTVPRLTPEGFYEVYLGTLDGEHSTNLAGAVNVILAPIPFDDVPDFPEPGITLTAVRARLRMELGDYVESFSSTIEGDGETRRFELPTEAIVSDGLAVEVDDGSTVTQLTGGTDYTLEAKQGIISLFTNLAEGSTLSVQGLHGQFFTDEELDTFITSALLKHTHNATRRTSYRDPITGRIRYIVDAQTLANLSPVEAHPIAILAATEALWVLAADASYDIDVVTSEGTSLPRQQRYRAIMQMIEAQEARYLKLAQQLGVGMGRLEMFTLRRVSRTTGRLVPVYQAREYDDHARPMRLYPPVDTGLTGSGSMKRAHTADQYPPEVP